MGGDKAQKRPLRALSALLVAGPLTLLAGSACRRQISFVPQPSASPSRRGVLGASVAAGLAPALDLAAPRAARAEAQAWQLRLPRSWQVFQQNEAPPSSVLKPTVLVVAANPDTEGELVVVRAPLTNDPKDKNFAAAEALRGYFNAPKGKTPSVSVDKALDGVTSSQRGATGQVSFEMIGQPNATTKGSMRYITYNFKQVICQGEWDGKVCKRVDDLSEMPLLERRHECAVAVSDEDTKGATSFLWLVDVSGPVGDKWEGVRAEADDMTQTFVLGTGEELDAARTVEVTEEQAKEIMEYNQKVEEINKQAQVQQQAPGGGRGIWDYIR